MNTYFLILVKDEYVLTSNLEEYDNFRFLALTNSNQSINKENNPVKSFFLLEGNRIILDEEYVFIDDKLTTLYTIDKYGL